MTSRTLHSPSGRHSLGTGGGVGCIGHRGARAFAPENTLPAFRLAAAMGCVMIELDVHLSGDGEVVVHHDDRLGRCTDVQAKFPGRCNDFLSDFSLAELRLLDAGSHCVRALAAPPGRRPPYLASLGDAERDAHVTPEALASYAGGGVRIPTLREAMELALELDLMVNVELKTIPRMYHGMAEKVVALVAALGLQRSVLVSSFDHPQLLRVRELMPGLATGVLSSDRLARPADYLRLLDADAYHPGCYDDFDSLGFGSVTGRVDPRGMQQVRGAGGMVFPWTCNERGRIAALIAAGASGIITDYPNRFADAVAVTAT